MWWTLPQVPFGCSCISLFHLAVQSSEKRNTLNFFLLGYHLGIPFFMQEVAALLPPLPWDMPSWWMPFARKVQQKGIMSVICWNRLLPLSTKLVCVAPSGHCMLSLLPLAVLLLYLCFLVLQGCGSLWMPYSEKGMVMSRSSSSI